VGVVEDVVNNFKKEALKTTFSAQKLLKKTANRLSNLTSVQEFLFFKLIFALSVQVLVRREPSTNLVKQTQPIINLIYKQQAPQALLKFLPSLSVLLDSLNFSRFGEHLAKLFSLISRRDLRKFFRFIAMFISSLKFVGLLGSKIFYKGKLSWKALSRKKRDKISRGKTSKTNLELLSCYNFTEVRNSTGRISTKISIFFLFVLFKLYSEVRKTY